MTTFALISEVGSRTVNEDSVAAKEGPAGLLCVLCDGLGGHGAGEVASALAVRACMAVFDNPPEDLQDLLPLCVAEAQNALVNEQQRQNRPHDIKTTITLLHIKDDLARWAHVGDSRVYLFQRDKLATRTLDHSVPQMLAIQGEIRERDIRFHEDRNRLTRVMGMEWDSPRYELSDQMMLAPPCSFLMCSDGFWELVDEKEMARQLRGAPAPADWLRGMQAVVEKNGKGKKMDNYSALAVFVR